jgi:hypothetical protein
MPLITQSAVGSDTVVPGVANKYVANTVGVAGATTNTDPLLVNQLPNLVFYVIQTAGAVPAQVTPQFSLRRFNDGVNPTPQPQFLNLSGPIVMPALNVPLILNYTFPCNLTRLQFASPAGQTTTFQLILGAYGP